MANGKTHDLITASIAIALPLLSTHYGLSQSAAISLAFGAASGLMLSPDNDMHHSRPSKRWKCFNELLFAPYRAWVGGHRVKSCRSCFGRNPKSHLPVLATIPRLPYAALLLSPLIWQWCQDGVQAWEAAIALWYVAGLMVADIGHWAADGLFS